MFVGVTMKKLSLFALLFVAGTMFAAQQEGWLQGLEKKYEAAKEKVKSYLGQNAAREQFAKEGYPPTLEDNAGGYAGEFIWGTPAWGNKK